MKTLQGKNKSALIIIVASIAFFFACRKTDSDTGIPTTNPPPVTIITASVAGRVTDMNNVPVIMRRWPQEHPLQPRISTGCLS